MVSPTSTPAPNSKKSNLDSTVTYDPDVKALYIKALKDTRIAKTIPLREGINLDVSEDNRLVGLELLFSNSNLASEEVTDILNKIPELPH